MRGKAVSIGFSFLLVLMATTPQWGLAAEKVKIGTATKLFYPYNLTYLAAEEKGLWKENGLEAELVLFETATRLHQAMAAGHIDVGMVSANSPIEAAAAGAPILVVAHLVTKGTGFYLWVRADSPIKDPRDLKGGKIAVGALGSTGHGYGRIMAKALGLEREIKFLGIGGGATMVAALRAGKVDGSMNTLGPFANLLAAGEVRKVLSVEDYLPKRWVGHVIIARRDFLDRKPEVIRKVAKVLGEASELLKQGPEGALKKLKEEFHLSTKAAQIVYDDLIANIEFGKIDREGLENIWNFLVEYGILAKEKAAPIDAIYRNIFD